ncbi:hypothetical protein D3C80_2115100 [compost metagenome]
MEKIVQPIGSGCLVVNPIPVWREVDISRHARLDGIALRFNPLLVVSRRTWPWSIFQSIKKIVHHTAMQQKRLA